MHLSLAPLHGITGRVFRSAYFRHFSGFDECFAPFILAVRTERRKDNHFRDLLPLSAPSPVPLVPQLLGNDAESILESIRILADMGYGEVNWNLGCPYPMVAKKTRGSGLLPHPELVSSILETVCAESPVPFSIKLRLGRESAEEIFALLPVLNSYPLKRLILHPRLGVQMYKGTVDLDSFEKALPLSVHPMGYNGDILDKESFSALHARFPSIENWMIGRGALINPFLPLLLKGEDLPGNPLAVLRAFHDDLYASYAEALSGPAHLLDKMKEVWSYLAQNMEGSGRELAALPRAKKAADYLAVVEKVFERASFR